MMKDDWLTAALMDDTVVVELLFRLKQSSFSQPSDACTPLPPHPMATKLLHMRLPSPSWGHRQPRSKPTASTIRKEAKAGSTERCSPTTPLSWSGGVASPSDGGYDESSRLPSSSDLTSAFRSKVTFTNETSNVRSSSEGFRRKKTFADLMEEENLLLKERELASLHVTLNEQKARSEDLKRIKFDLNLQSACDMGVGPHVREAAPSNQCNLMEPSITHSVLSRHTADDDLVLSSSQRTQKPVETQNKGSFILPDLNITPLEEEAGLGWN